MEKLSLAHDFWHDKKMNLLIVSIGHTWQLVEQDQDSPTVRGQKLAFRGFLRGIISGCPIGLIFEESALGKLSIAAQLSRECSPAIPWRNIVMEDDERKTAGIFESLRNRPEEVVFDNSIGGMPSRILRRIPADDVLESFFIDKILEAKDNYLDVLVLLGNMHVTSVAERLRSLGHCVVIRDELMATRH